MKLLQLRLITAIAQNGLNITAAAKALRTSQPAISKHVKQLEDELGVTLFVRSGRVLANATPAGRQVIARALRILRDADGIKEIASELRDGSRGTLSVGATHAQARYVLPRVFKQLRARYPQVELHLHQGTSDQLALMVKQDQLDFAIASGSEELFPRLVILPCYQWDRKVIVPLDHPLARMARLSLRQLLAYPIVTYEFGFSSPDSLEAIFAKVGLKPNIVLTARDADVIKTYVRLGLGAGVIASVAVDPTEDRDLVVIEAAHLFASNTTWIGFPRERLLRGYMYDFLQTLAPHLSRRLVEGAAKCATATAVGQLMSRIDLPRR